MDIFHSVLKSCSNLLFYGTIYISNALLSVVLKIICEDPYIYTSVTYKTNRISYKLEGGNYNMKNVYIKQSSIKQISLQLTRNLESIIRISNLKLIIHRIVKKPINTYANDYWKTDYYNLDNDLRCIELIKNKLSYFHFIINSLELFYENDTDFKVYISKVSILRRRGSNKIIIQLGRIKLYYKNIFIASINKNKIIVADNDGVLSKSINIDSININIFTKILFNNFIENAYQIYKELTIEGGEKLPDCRINSVCINAYLLNYIQLNCKNIVVDNDVFKIGHILGKIWKKDSIWINDMNIHLNNNKYPEIKHLRIRLFTSTSDKLYKTFIILRKKFYPIHESKKNIKREPILPCDYINNNYITCCEKTCIGCPENNYTNDKMNVDNTSISTTYVKELMDINMEYKIFIKSIQIDLSYDGGKIVANKVFIKKDNTHNYLHITDWVFYKHKIKYISKYNTETTDQFIFKFNNDEMDITPYKLIIFLDTEQFSYSFNIIKNNISRLTQLFSSNFYYYNRGYIFERFYIRSFYTKFSYKKRQLKLGKLIEGNKLQLLNCLKVNNIDLILKEVVTFYPNHWDQVIGKIINVYADSIYEYNMDSIIKKIAGPRTASIMNIKQNLKSLKKKLKNIK